MGKKEIALQKIATIKNATIVGENTAERVGEAMEAMIDVHDDYVKKEEVEPIAEDLQLMSDAMPKNSPSIIIEVGNVSLSNGQNADDDTRLRTRDFVTINGDELIALVNIDSGITRNGGERFYDSEKNYLGTSYTSEAAFVRAVWTRTSDIDLGLVYVLFRGTRYYATESYSQVASEKELAALESLIRNMPDNNFRQLFSNYLNNDISNFDTTKRLSTSGALISNAGSTRHIINNALVLPPGVYYVTGCYGYSAPRISKNGTSLITPAQVSTGVYSFELTEQTTVYIDWLASNGHLENFAVITQNLDWDTIQAGVIIRKYIGFENPEDFTALVEEVTVNMINPANIDLTKRYSKASKKIVARTGSEIIGYSGFIAVKEGETYCLSGDGIYGVLQRTEPQGGYYAAINTAINSPAIDNISFYSAHGSGFYFTVPTGGGIKYVILNLTTNSGATELAGNAQMEVGENPTDYVAYNPEPKIKSELLPVHGGGGSGGSSDVALIDHYTTFCNIHYPNISDKIPNFRKHWLLKDKDLVVVNTGTSLTARDYCAPHPDAAYRPPLMHTYNFATHIWDKLNWGGQYYRRYDAMTEEGGSTPYFTETGTFATVATDDLWDDSSYRRGYTRLSASGTNSVAFAVPQEAWQFNFIFRTDANGCESCTVTIAEGNGYMQVWNGSAWVEANGYVFSMREGSSHVATSVVYKNPKTGGNVTISSLPTGGNTTYQKRLKMRCTTHRQVMPDGTTIVAGTTKNVAISGTGRFMYWGVEWSKHQYMITYVNAARGSHGPLIAASGKNLIHYQDNEVWSFAPDLILTEDPIFNGGGGGARLWFNGNTPDTPNTYWGQVVENFFFADNQVSMMARATAIMGEGNEPEFAIFGPYSTALDGKVDGGQLRKYPTLSGMMSVADALQTIPPYMRENHPDVIYINCVRTWLEVCETAFSGIEEATASSGYTGNSLCADGVHPNTLGCRVWARLVLPILDFTL